MLDWNMGHAHGFAVFLLDVVDKEQQLAPHGKVAVAQGRRRVALGQRQANLGGKR